MLQEDDFNPQVNNLAVEQVVVEKRYDKHKYSLIELFEFSAVLFWFCLNLFLIRLCLLAVAKVTLYLHCSQPRRSFLHPRIAKFTR